MIEKARGQKNSACGQSGGQASNRDSLQSYASGVRWRGGHGQRSITLFFAAILLCVCTTFATDRYVSPTGANTGAGGIGSPWLTIQYAVNNSSAGDRIFLNDGMYTERVAISSGKGNKKFLAVHDGGAIWVGGFTVSQGEDQIECFGIRFKDGPSNPDWEGIVQFYHSSAGAALGANCGFTNCWFIGTLDPTTHNVIGLSMEPPTAYAKYAQNFTLVGCVFTNTSQFSVSLYPRDGLIASNRFDFANSHDAMHIWGTNVNICYNTFTNISANPSVSDHTDLIQFWWDGANPSFSSPSTNIFIHHNLFVNSAAQFFQIEGDISSMNNVGPIGGIYVYNNIWNNVQHHGSIDVPDFHVWNNLFYNCIMSDGSGDLLFFAGPRNPKGESKNSSIRNNAFVGCGNTGNSTTTGWYDASELGVPSGFVADYNFVCNADFTPKNNTDFRANGFEAHGINGGDPKFEYAAGNLFHLRQGSPLIDAGATIVNLTKDYEGNARPLGSAYDIGPYEFDPSLLVKFNPAVPFTSGMDNLAGGPQDGVQMQSTNWPYSTNFQGRAGAVFTVRTGNQEGGTEVGYGDYVAITNLTGLQSMTNGTISFWAKYSTITNWDNQLRVERIFDAGYQGMPWSDGTFFIGRGYSDVTGDSYQTVMRLYGTDGLANPTTLLTWPDHVSSADGSTTNLLHYVMTWSPGANNLRGYINGVLVTSNTLSVPYLKMTNDFNWVGIGCWTHDGSPSLTDGDGYPNNGWFHGILGETRIYNRTLSESEVAALYADSGAASSSVPNGGPPPGATATFVTSDIATGGSWKGVYGSEGYLMAAASPGLPPYATATTSAPQWTWVANSSNPTYLQVPENSTNRIAACWYSSTQLAFDLSINDGKPHRLSMYFIDASSSGRQERVDLIDRATGATLDSRNLSDFANGIYLTWDITGNVSIRITPTTVNAVVSGIFFDGVPNAPFTAATFVKSDTTTVGNWKGVYGAEGYWMAAAGASLPTYATLATAAPQWTWSTQTTSACALALPGNTTGRIAACWYSASQLGFDLSLSDGQAHRISFYFLDATASGRQQRIDVIDRATGAILDSRLLANFSTGVYVTWDITGNVSVRLTPSAVNAVASGLFFDAAP